MIAFDEALAMVRQHCTPLAVVTRPARDAAGLALAADVHASEAIPLFDSSSVDGYAINTADAEDASASHPVYLPVQGILHAGDAAVLPLRKGNAVRIMTGAILPHGADAVLMQEQVQERDGLLRIATPVKAGKHVRRRGAEYSEAQLVLQQGTRITPPVAGLLAVLGVSRVNVRNAPRVAVLVTGDEVRDPSATLKPGQLRDANSFSFAAALEALGCDVVSMQRVQDDKAALAAAVSAALKECDILLTIGGVSVGVHDYIREVFDALRITQHFWGVAMKPGKPNYFGTKGKRLVFGLPGNPVSALLSFHVLVRPAIACLMGLRNEDAQRVEVILDKDMQKDAGRTEFVRMTLLHDEKGRTRATPSSGQESHMLGGLAAAQALFRFDQEKRRVQAGSRITVELLQWSWK